ncbi:MAG TPA: XrtA/PEP-CTERM system histidine kinase PrsK [Telluria sp.]|nr:XrtA/PEP-CTERM system histidine kinase PrsK [Telluria sp.]
MDTNSGAIGYVLAAAALLCASLYALRAARSSAVAMAVGTGLLPSALWCLAAAFAAAQPATGAAISATAESLRTAGLYGVVLHLLGRQLLRGPVALAAWTTCLLPLAAMFGPFDAVFALLGRLAGAVFGIVLVELLYRGSEPHARWAVKVLCLGVGGMFAYDLYLYSDASLLRRVDADLAAARGWANALCVPLIVIGCRRSAAWPSRFALSRHLVLHSAALVGSAVYVLAMGSAGYLLRLWGGTWGGVMQLAFLFGAVLLLVGALFSGSVRAWVRVTLSKHFFRYRYDYRAEWLRFTATLSGRAEGLGEGVVAALAALVESPGGLLWLRGGGDDYEPAAHVLVPPLRQTIQSESSFCRLLGTHQWVVDLSSDAPAMPVLADVAVPEWLRSYPRAWLVVPLLLREELVGFVLLTLPRSPVRLNWEMIDVLRVAGRQAAGFLAQQQAADALAQARQFESFNRMAAFVVHDIKNLVAQLSLVASNAARHGADPAFQRDMAYTLAQAVEKMKQLVRRLVREPDAEVRRPVEVGALVTRAAARPGHIFLDIGEEALPVLADEDRLERVLGHVLQNAAEASADGARVEVLVRRQNAYALVEVRDHGCGMSEQFVRHDLFKAFASTKQSGMGIGAFEVREYVRELGGRVEVDSRLGAGTSFRILLPVAGAGGEHEQEEGERQPGRVEHAVEQADGKHSGQTGEVD